MHGETVKSIFLT